MQTRLLSLFAAALVSATLAACDNLAGGQSPAPTGNRVVALIPAGNASSPVYGYWEINANGSIQQFGNIATIPSCSAMCPGGIVDATVAGTPSATNTAVPVWLLTGQGTVVGENGAPRLGNWQGAGPASFIISTPDGQGYWLGNSTELEAFGSAHSFSSGLPGDGVVGGLAQSDNGLLLALSDGQVVALGSAQSYGGCLGVCGAPVVAIVGDGTAGYWLVDAHGGVYTFGQAQFYGAGVVDNKTFVTAAAPPGGQGYWLVDAQGQVYSFGQAPYVVGDNPVVMGIGDSMAATLTADLSLSAPPGITVDNNAIPGCGIAQGGPIVVNGMYIPSSMLVPPCSGLPGATPWETKYQNAVAQNAPTEVLLLVGYWESVWRLVNGQWQHIGQPGYDAYLRGQLTQALDILTAGGAHVTLLTTPYVAQGLPGTQSPLPPGTPSGAETVVTHQDTDQWNALAESVANQWPTQVSVMDLNAQVDPGGQFAESIDGLTVRAPDGVHFPFFNTGAPDQPAPDTMAQCQAFGHWIGQWLWPQILDIPASDA